MPSQIGSPPFGASLKAGRHRGARKPARDEVAMPWRERATANASVAGECDRTRRQVSQDSQELRKNLQASAEVRRPSVLAANEPAPSAPARRTDLARSVQGDRAIEHEIAHPGTRALCRHRPRATSPPVSRAPWRAPAYPEPRRRRAPDLSSQSPEDEMILHRFGQRPAMDWAPYGTCR